ncbi:hypothetical protein KILIM_022_00120 [Kineosphaera limosa NBRC 100340]|uniref:Phosphoadenosine phosphosulfate reductase n=1 Tax=Kineosphaera limosa NBRC 100340 TaxID=1184609 RepID=K6VH48_9MICO|nr:hypothetical protein KILIM_022_00120 [Kineosphaera limosa NBRC 100340]
MIGRVQATLIGAGRVAVSFSGDPQSALLLTIAARALGAQRVSLLLDPIRPPAPGDDALAQEIASELGCRVLRTWSPGQARPTDVAHLPIDTVAYCAAVDAPGRVPVRTVDRQRVLFPFVEAGVRLTEVAACAQALGVSAQRLPNGRRAADGA